MEEKEWLVLGHEFGLNPESRSTLLLVVSLLVVGGVVVSCCRCCWCRCDLVVDWIV